METRPPAAVERYMITLPQRESTPSSGLFDTFDVANDGTAIAYMAAKSPIGVDIFVRSQDQVAPVNIATSDNFPGIGMPTLSPDGKWLAYGDSSQVGLVKRPVLGGPGTTYAKTSRLSSE